MDLDRGTLARIDRKVGSGLGRDEVYRTLRVAATDAIWSTWKRYCDSAGVSMGRAVMELIGNELRSVVAESTVDIGPVFSGLAEERLEARVAKIEARERAVGEAEKRLSESTQRLRAREGALRRLERQVREAAVNVVQPSEPGNKVGRNERCPCNSGLKCKALQRLTGQAGWISTQITDS